MRIKKGNDRRVGKEKGKQSKGKQKNNMLVVKQL